LAGYPVVKTRTRLLFLLSGAFLLGALAGNGLPGRASFAQGYEGLIAPDKNADDHKTHQPGYKGVIPGDVPEDIQAPAPPRRQTQTVKPPTAAPVAPLRQQTAVAPPVKTQPQVTYAPGYVPAQIETVNDLKMAAGVVVPKSSLRMDQLPPGLVDKVGAVMTPEIKSRLAFPRLRIAGMLPKEYVLQEEISHLMVSIRDPALSEDQRRANARDAANALLGRAQAIQAQQNIAAYVYDKFSIPQTYVKEENETAEHSVARLKAAAANLKRYQ
jgi:hypothetical protein